mmetsp:Transcript_23174/g.33854  ORF Transcript_23174/g.33854 Transcript_23174/m.33854 type:complete len:439 (+) Transcript_23174:121-1437(+)|eukprot:CAMPEP_0195510702 /NCGR_PEP_ID=MMETSP0794_2-20130614/3263_1 /TAXON_ID=515487 /ORGANISM="Stephanopyxis turris, Strain CCMP 815" /LENGTH=438 /DNA_ID=CAMNT_0040638177 /DNA_START=108 /DNA_END=1424 /DNA_ORIENTATION=+
MMVSSGSVALDSKQDSMERLDAAHALLGGRNTSLLSQSHFIIPETVQSENEVAVVTPGTSPNTTSSSMDILATRSALTVTEKNSQDDEWEKVLIKMRSQSSYKFPLPGKVKQDPCPLDALALLASNAITIPTQKLTDAEAMPPPPPVRRRERAISNPEGMDKWDSLNRVSQCHFTIYEECEDSCETDTDMENATNTDVVEATSMSRKALPFKKRLPSPLPAQQIEVEDQMEMLSRARSKLLEDLLISGENAKNSGLGGGLVLPHSLAKYSEVYNKNGRIGIYTPSERAAIIARFNDKRARRVWNKKIRYSCRKNLADRRLRVKGRFVKRNTNSKSDKTNNNRIKIQQKQPEMTKTLWVATIPTDKDAKATTTVKVTMKGLSPLLPSPSSLESSPNMSPIREEDTAEHEVDMPDVTDVEAGFAPTEDQPYRRTRRHTIT